MNMEFQNRRANSLDKDAAAAMGRGHTQVHRTNSSTSSTSEEPSSYMNVSFGASPTSQPDDEGYAYMEPAPRRDRSGDGVERSLSNTSTTSSVPHSVVQSDGMVNETEGEYVNVNFDQRKSAQSPQPKRNVPPALVLKPSPGSDTSEYMNVEPGSSAKRSSPCTPSPTSPAAQMLRHKTLEKSLEEMRLQQINDSPGKSSLGSPRSQRSSSSSGTPNSMGSPRLGTHNGVRNLLLGVSPGQSRSAEPSPRLSSRHNARRSSDTSSPLDEKELNYIDVDIGAPGTGQSNIERRARSPFHRRTAEEDNQETTNYATIDFTKSEGLRVMTNKRQHESRH